MRVYLRVCVLPVRMRAVYVSMNGGGGWLVGCLGFNGTFSTNRLYRYYQ